MGGVEWSECGVSVGKEAGNWRAGGGWREWW